MQSYIMYVQPTYMCSTVPQSTYIPANNVVILGGFVATDTPGTPSLRAATNKEYVVPCCRFGSIRGEVEEETVMLPVPSL